MAIGDVKAFYQRLAQDTEFAQQIQAVSGKEECSQTVREAGFNFTVEEFEEYTSQLLEESDKPKDLSEKELELVFGGATFLGLPPILPMYGGIIPPKPRPFPFPQPIYGVIIPSDYSQRTKLK